MGAQSRARSSRIHEHESRRPIESLDEPKGPTDRGYARYRCWTSGKAKAYTANVNSYQRQIWQHLRNNKKGIKERNVCLVHDQRDLEKKNRRDPNTK